MSEDTLAHRRDGVRQGLAEAETRMRSTAEGIPTLNIGLGIDSDDNDYRRLTTGQRAMTRDLSSMTHDRSLEVSWYLWEQNPFARRLITLMTDLIIGEGATVQVVSDDNRIQEQIDRFWTRNQMAKRLREFYLANSLNGELCFPVGINEISGMPVLGYVDSCQIKSVGFAENNLLDLQTLTLKGNLVGAEPKLDIIREDPSTGKLVGNAFFHKINSLPNSMRGRPDLAPLADWLDLYDQFMFNEIERMNLITAFAWDYTIKGAKDDKAIADKIRALPKLKSGAVFGHNEEETLEPRTPDMKAHQTSDVARLLRVHIAGSMGFPISYFGDMDSNNATIQGQNDIMLKTPAARQKEFAGLLNLMVRYVLEQTMAKNPILFDGAIPKFKTVMPEIAAKDIARVGTVLSSVLSAMDTGIANKTVSRKLAIRVMVGMIKQLGIDADPQEIANEIEGEEDERQEMADLVQAEMARRTARNPNPPVPGDPDPNDEGNDTRLDG